MAPRVPPEQFDLCLSTINKADENKLKLFVAQLCGKNPEIVKQVLAEFVGGEKNISSAILDLQAENELSLDSDEESDEESEESDEESDAQPHTGTKRKALDGIEGNRAGPVKRPRFEPGGGVDLCYNCKSIYAKSSNHPHACKYHPGKSFMPRTHLRVDQGNTVMSSLLPKLPHALPQTKLTDIINRLS